MQISKLIQQAYRDKKHVLLILNSSGEFVKRIFLDKDFGHVLSFTEFYSDLLKTLQNHINDGYHIECITHEEDALRAEENNVIPN